MLDTKKKNNVLIIGLITPQNKMVYPEYYFKEFEKLVETNFIVPTFRYFSKLRSIDPSTYVTKGKLEEIKKICIENNIDEIIFSEKLSPHQEMRLEKILEVTVYDRTHLILEIFEKQAHSDEAKIQVELAFLEHKKTRVAGHGSHFSQQSGRFGIISGAGETQKELDLRHIDHLMQRLNKELKKIESHKNRQRKDRIKNNVYSISIIGYTNAGKSTLFNTLTKASVFVEDKLFATLNTTTRELFISDKLIKKIVITDTVGFIQNIPHELIVSFHSTLAELKYSSLLLHLIDISDKDWKQQYHTVRETIKELDAEKIPVVEVFNKIDLLDSIEYETLKIKLTEDNKKDIIFINATDKKSTIELIQKITEIIEKEKNFYKIECK
jgi:GTP-binding protein HflX